MKKSVFALATLGCLCAAFAQTPRFEVASIRERIPPFSRMYVITASGPRFQCEACAVIELIMYAYDLKIYQVSFPPSFRDRETRYDVVAKADGAPTKAEFRQMVRSLLSERFKLTVHRGTKEMAVYALVIGKNGPKLKESAPDTAHYWLGSVAGRNNQVTMRNVSMEEIMTAITNASLDRPVVDKTGLTRTYDATLTYTPNWREADLSDLNILNAVQEQLGLKLEPQKDNVEILVVDRVEKPSDN